MENQKEAWPGTWHMQGPRKKGGREHGARATSDGESDSSMRQKDFDPWHKATQKGKASGASEDGDGAS
eukprot:7196651-Karenia_brevis.AAC.1